MMWKLEKRIGGVQSEDEWEKEEGKMSTLGSVFSVPFFAAPTVVMRNEGKKGHPSCPAGCFCVCVCKKRKGKKRGRKPTFQAGTESSSLEINSPLFVLLVMIQIKLKIL